MEKTLNDYQAQKIQHLKAKLAYHRARMSEAVGSKVEYHKSKVEYALNKLAYFGYSEEGQVEEV